MINEDLDFQVVNVAFPHIGKKIELLWGHPEFHELIRKLKQDTRGGARRGFPAGVLFSLDNLETQHEREFPHLRGQEASVWGLNDFK